VPVPNAHYLENTGKRDLVYLGRQLNCHVERDLANQTDAEVLQASVYSDISVAQWLGLTPKQVVKDHLGFSEKTLDRLPHIKPYILPGSTNALQTNFTKETV
jgi:oxalate decarboxylase/phosphoglucose isomerase-like protein (cupin superfamily)